MIPPNILRLMSPEDQEKEREAQRKAERYYLAKSEKTEQGLFNTWLMLQRDAGQLWFLNCPMHRPSTIEPGHPDYTIFLENGRVLLIEIKVEGGKLSHEQKTAILFLEDLDHPVHICWNHVQAINVVQLYLSVSPNDHHRTQCPGQATSNGQTRT